MSDSDNEHSVGYAYGILGLAYIAYITDCAVLQHSVNGDLALLRALAEFKTLTDYYKIWMIASGTYAPKSILYTDRFSEASIELSTPNLRDTPQSINTRMDGTKWAH